MIDRLKWQRFMRTIEVTAAEDPERGVANI
jgi:hypothetical protein